MKPPVIGRSSSYTSSLHHVSEAFSAFKKKKLGWSLELGEILTQPKMEWGIKKYLKNHWAGSNLLLCVMKIYKTTTFVIISSSSIKLY